MNTDWREIIKQETERCKITTYPTPDGKDTYQYLILPFESRMVPRFLRAIVQGLSYLLYDELDRTDTILLPEAKAFLLTPLALDLGIDAVAIRKRDYKLPYQITFTQTKAYQDGAKGSFMHCVALKKDDRHFLLEDTISSGGTVIGIVNELKKKGYELVGIGSVYERGDGVKNIMNATGYYPKSLARFDIINGKPSVNILV
jgi:adenine/guanine phosphoribosyltransferase-like PRPP-binding protein